MVEKLLDDETTRRLEEEQRRKVVAIEFELCDGSHVTRKRFEMGETFSRYHHEKADSIGLGSYLRSPSGGICEVLSIRGIKQAEAEAEVDATE